jgi:hypothetical protein
MRNKTAASIPECAGIHFYQGRYVGAGGEIVGAEVEGGFHHDPDQCGVQFQVRASE